MSPAPAPLRPARAKRSPRPPQAHPVAELGQVFTRAAVVAQMLALRRNSGRVLEPSAGDGAFARHLPEGVAIELDERVAPPGALVQDFFAYPLSEQFETIIGNPPYVRHQDILPATKALLTAPWLTELFDRRSNLYLYFIAKCVRHLKPGGELIFITPRDFIKLTAARKLNNWLAEQGSFTHFMETGDSNIFGPYVPNCAIWRFEKGRREQRLDDGRRVVTSRGQLMFTRGDYPVRLGDVFQVKVGAVSGADEVFSHPAGNLEFVCSTTVENGQTRRMLFEQPHPALLAHKDRLLARKVKAFGEHNWWTWGRRHFQSDAPRIYVNGKTRRPRPFFLHPSPHYDGAVLALFPRNPALDLAQAVAWLNERVDWQDLGFVCDGRFLFTQRSLENAGLPDCFAPYGQPA